MPMYDVEFANPMIFNFSRNLPAINAAANDFNTFANNSKRNVRKILDVSIDTQNPEILKIRFDSQKVLRENREGNAIKMLSQILVENYGFDRFLSPSGKLFRSSH